MNAKPIYKVLAQVNKWFLPKLSKKDITRLSKFQKAIVAYRYWVTINSLD
jgi:hypothetical protein